MSTVCRNERGTSREVPPRWPSEKESIASFVDRIAALSPQLVTFTNCRAAIRSCSMRSTITAGKGSRRSRWSTFTFTPAAKPWLGMSRPQGEGSHRNQRNNPMLLHMHQAPRCGARTRRGSPCQSPAMKNGRCRMHGGLSPGAPKGNKHALKHGRYTADAIARRREIRELLRAMKASASTAREQT